MPAPSSVPAWARWQRTAQAWGVSGRRTLPLLSQSLGLVNKHTLTQINRVSWQSSASAVAARTIREAPCRRGRQGGHCHEAKEPSPSTRAILRDKNRWRHQMYVNLYIRDRENIRSHFFLLARAATSFCKSPPGAGGCVANVAALAAAPPPLRLRLQSRAGGPVRGPAELGFS